MEGSQGDHLRCVVFDMDGVITQTATVHAAAWKEMFDEYLRMRAERGDEAFREFTYENDYRPYVDGKPRYKGIRSFLESRDIHISEGSLSDGPDVETICGLGAKKNNKFVEVIKNKGVALYPPVIELIKDLKRHGIKIGVASSSKNCEMILEAAGVERLFETRVDGVVSAELGLKGKPEGDIFVTAAENLGCNPKHSVVVEDAVSGVQAGRNGGFALVVGVAREGNAEELRSNGADVVVENFEGISTDEVRAWMNQVNR